MRWNALQLLGVVKAEQLAVGLFALLAVNHKHRHDAATLGETVDEHDASDLPVSVTVGGAS